METSTVFLSDAFIGFAIGGVTDAVIGGVTGLISAHNKGYDLWSGQPKQLSPQVNIDTELLESVAPKADTETLIFKEGNEPRLSVPIAKKQ